MFTFTYVNVRKFFACQRLELSHTNTSLFVRSYSIGTAQTIDVAVAAAVSFTLKRHLKRPTIQPHMNGHTHNILECMW